MYRKALTKQGSNKRGVKPQHIDSRGNKKDTKNPQNSVGEKDTKKEGKGVDKQNNKRDMLHCYIQTVK